MSKRSEMAERLAEVIREKRMTQPFGGDVERSDGKYLILFAVPRHLDGLVTIWSEKFILIKATGPLVAGGNFKNVYESEEDAAKVLRAIADGDHDLAASVPVRTRKEKVK